MNSHREKKKDNNNGGYTGEGVFAYERKKRGELPKGDIERKKSGEIKTIARAPAQA